MYRCVIARIAVPSTLLARADETTELLAALHESAHGPSAAFN
jgi:hypothetical protein